MHNAVRGMLSEYACETGEDYLEAAMEILQELMLLGLREEGFLEKAAIHGGTALRVLHGLDRPCETLEFCLLSPDPGFSMKGYSQGLESHLSRFDFSGEFQADRTGGGLLKGTIRGFLQDIGAPEPVLSSYHYRKLLKMPVLVETEPIKGFSVEQRFVPRPVPFPIQAVSLRDTFAWKIHSILSCPGPVSGMDWLDFAWYVAKFPEFRFSQLEAMLRASGTYDDEAPLTLDWVHTALINRLKGQDMAEARNQAAAAVWDPSGLRHWSPEFFYELIGDMEPV